MTIHLDQTRNSRNSLPGSSVRFRTALSQRRAEPRDHAALIGLALRQCRTGRISDPVFAHLVKAAGEGDAAAHVVMLHATAVRDPWVRPLIDAHRENVRAIKAAIKTVRRAAQEKRDAGGRHD